MAARSNARTHKNVIIYMNKSDLDDFPKDFRSKGMENGPNQQQTMANKEKKRSHEVGSKEKTNRKVRPRRLLLYFSNFELI